MVNIVSGIIIDTFGRFIYVKIRLFEGLGKLKKQGYRG